MRAVSTEGAAQGPASWSLGRRLPPFFALRALEAAARHRSYSKAAAELAVTHSAVSQQIRRLEAEFETRLFVRHGHVMEPLPEALALAAEISRALEVLQSGLGAFEGARGREPLVVSVETTLARRWLPQFLPQLLAQPMFANLEVRVDNQHANFGADGVDVGIRCGPGGWEGLEATMLFPVTLVVVCCPDFARRHRIRRPCDLLDLPLLHRAGRSWAPWFQACGLTAPPPRGLVFDDFLMLLEAAVQGLGAALAPRELLEPEFTSGRLVQPLPVGIPSPFSNYLVWRADSRKLARIHALRDCLLARTAPVGAGAA